MQIYCIQFTIYSSFFFLACISHAVSIKNCILIINVWSRCELWIRTKITWWNECARVLAEEKRLNKIDGGRKIIYNNKSNKKTQTPFYNIQKWKALWSAYFPIIFRLFRLDGTITCYVNSKIENNIFKCDEQEKCQTKYNLAPPVNQALEIWILKLQTWAKHKRKLHSLSHCWTFNAQWFCLFAYWFICILMVKPPASQHNKLHRVRGILFFR